MSEGVFKGEISLPADYSQMMQRGRAGNGKRDNKCQVNVTKFNITFTSEKKECHGHVKGLYNKTYDDICDG